jgi:hypothetical protein
MEGMECWTGEFANAAGRAKLVKDITNLKEELVGAEELYTILNAEYEREAADARAFALADARDAANKLTNKIVDAQKRETKFEAAMAGVTGDALAAAQTEFETAKAATIALQEEKRAGDEAYASLSVEDAEGRVGLLELEFDNKKEELASLVSETEYERRLIDQFRAEAEDAAKSNEDRAYAAEQLALSVEHVDTNTTKQNDLNSIMELIKEELESQKERFENYTDKLETAADVRAAAALGKQTDEYNAIKTKRDELKATYDALVKHDDEGTFTDNNLFSTYEKGLDALYAAEEEYYHQEDIYTSAKAALELRTEEANEKAYAKSKAEEVRATADLAAATAGATAAQAAVATIAEAVTAAEAEVERILKIFNSGASN